ncbi:hypothetical protein [Nocardia sp. NPDC052112]|uniref:hypothetical protein n=1 Tax=Nocardia sp. NPDC052112 TaxID=3155646 RepID=UPI00342DF9D1
MNRWSENTYADWGSNTFTTARTAPTWWMNRPTHKDNILDRNVTKLGGGVVPAPPAPASTPPTPRASSSSNSSPAAELPCLSTIRSAHSARHPRTLGVAGWCGYSGGLSGDVSTVDGYLCLSLK